MGSSSEMETREEAGLMEDEWAAAFARRNINVQDLLSEAVNSAAGGPGEDSHTPVFVGECKKVIRAARARRWNCIPMLLESFCCLGYRCLIQSIVQWSDEVRSELKVGTDVQPRSVPKDSTHGDPAASSSRASSVAEDARAVALNNMRSSSDAQGHSFDISITLTSQRPPTANPSAPTRQSTYNVYGGNIFVFNK